MSVCGAGPLPWTPAWWARWLGTAALVLVATAPWWPVWDLGRRSPAADVAALSVWGQVVMGDAYRADVDPSAQTRLVTSGPFRAVRNPILSGVGLGLLGFVTLTPSPATLGSLVAAVVSLEVQVRWVEVPYLRSCHGDHYEGYAERAGRFVPGRATVRLTAVDRSASPDDMVAAPVQVIDLPTGAALDHDVPGAPSILPASADRPRSRGSWRRQVRRPGRASWPYSQPMPSLSWSRS